MCQNLSLLLCKFIYYCKTVAIFQNLKDCVRKIGVTIIFAMTTIAWQAVALRLDDVQVLTFYLHTYFTSTVNIQFCSISKMFYKTIALSG